MAQTFGCIGMRRAKRDAGTSGRSRGGLTMKMAALVDALGRLSRFTLLAGRHREPPAVPGLLSGLSSRVLLADRGFDSDGSRALLSTLRAEAEASPKSNRKETIDCDMEKYRRCHRVENFFRCIKHFRFALTLLRQAKRAN